MLDQEELDRLRALATMATSHSPGPRTISPDGRAVWNQYYAVYQASGSGYHTSPYELDFAVSAQNALLPLLEMVEALRGGGGNTVATPEVLGVEREHAPARKPRKGVR